VRRAGGVRARGTGAREPAAPAARDLSGATLTGSRGADKKATATQATLAQSVEQLIRKLILVASFLPRLP